MSNISITFKYNEKIIRDPLNLGEFQALGNSEIFPLEINHNSNKAIKDCGIFISPYSGVYIGTQSLDLDCNKVLWFADNFEGYGLFLNQDFVVFGEVYRQDGNRLIDVSRIEETDIFKGAEVEMLSGISNGEKRTVINYDVVNNLFNLDSDFTAALEGDRYKIHLVTRDVFKSQQGASEDYPIRLLCNAGQINRFESALITLELKIPPFIKEAGNHFFNLNLKYTPGE
jgi:hypothetical protein